MLAEIFDTTLKMFHVCYSLVDGAEARGARPCPVRIPVVVAGRHDEAWSLAVIGATHYSLSDPVRTGTS